MNNRSKEVVRDVTVHEREEIVNLVKKRAFQLAGNYMEMDGLTEQEIALQILKEAIKDLHS